MSVSKNSLLWKSKLAAWVHDPAEKALVLLRDKVGHEWGTVAELREILFGSRAMPSDVDEFVRRGDWYASAADRPQFPRQKSDGRYAKWSQVDFAQKPVLKHPLTGKDFRLQPLNDIPLDRLKTISKDHFENLIHKNGSEVDFCKTLLAFWRFGPDTPSGLGMHNLWQRLPADTRIPDHSIWSHLDTVSAYAGSMASDVNQSLGLLTVSFGPVQDFIFQSRSTSDLWAGSHLLSRISWEGMRVVAERLGPDSIIFPSLRGVPIVDVWLRDTMKLKNALFEKVDWTKTNLRSDANPLFSATLPNRFVAIVPSDQAQDLAQKIKEEVHQFIENTSMKAMDRILKEIGGEMDSDQYCYSQIKQQLEGFPEAYWAFAPWGLVERNKKEVDTTKLESVIKAFYPEGEESEFLKSSAWNLLGKEIKVDESLFYSPNPGTLYPAIYDLLDRLSAAGKSVRPFLQLNQEGYRSSLNGEREWLTLDRNQLNLPPSQRGETLWSRLAEKSPSWVKSDEYLDALTMIKRLWPTLFVDEVNQILDTNIRRYTLSTHALALSVSLDQWLDREEQIPNDIRDQCHQFEISESLHLPRLLRRKINKSNEREDAELLCRVLPVLYENEQLEIGSEGDEGIGSLNKIFDALSMSKPEAYYGILLFDGDKMGAWVAGNEDDLLIQFKQTWHPNIRNSVENRYDDKSEIYKYLNEKRPTSPARHRTISEALNGFSLKVARYVVEDCYKGKLIYSGGDDVMAMVCTDDLLSVMDDLNRLYSGKALNGQDIRSKDGYLQFDQDLICTMGEKATASCGAVIAHHQTPLALVLRELKTAESRAKEFGGRDAFCLKILKRSGGMIEFTQKWEYGNLRILKLIQDLSKLFNNDISRRAAYHIVNRLHRLPKQPETEMLQAIINHQFLRKAENIDLDDKRIHDIASQLSQLMGNDLSEQNKFDPQILENLLMTAEFLGRESRQK